MENKKKAIIVVSILLIYFIIMVCIYGIGKVKNKFYSVEMIMTPDSYLKYENGQWSDVKDRNELLEKSYHIYENSKFLYNGILYYTDNRWYAFDSTRKPLSLPEDFFAYRGNVTLDITYFNIIDMDEEEIKEAYEVLKEADNTIQSEIAIAQKTEFDINNDGVNETIYMIRSGYEDLQKYFAIVYLKINGKRDILISDISIDSYHVPSIQLKQILDYNKDHKYELIFQKTYFDQIGTCHEIFAEEKKSYRSVKSCELIERSEEQ